MDKQPQEMADELRRYVRRPDAIVVAIRLDLDFDGFSFRKWGHVQRCKPGDWLVLNNGDVHTVDARSFAATYSPVPDCPGQYRKTAPVWAYVATQDGEMRTREGVSQYAKGDFIVFNDADGEDGYPVPAEKFKDMYQDAPGD